MNEQSDTKNITIGEVFGEAVWLMSQSARHRHNFFLADLEWLLVPPIAHNQFRMFKADGKPFGMAFWAHFSEEVEARFSKGNIKLKSDEWNCGNRIWLIDLVAPFGHANKILADLQKTSLRETGFKCLQVDARGQYEAVFYEGKGQREQAGVERETASH